jgi:putative ABC transport system permease protein
MVATVRLENLNMRGSTTSAVEFRELSDMSDVFAAVAASEGRSWTSDQAGEPVRLVGSAVTSDYFRVFGAMPAAGRFPGPDEPASAVLSYRLWETQFGGDSAVIGRALMLDGQLHRVVAVAPNDFRFPPHAQLWTSLTFSPQRMNRRGNNMNLSLLARLKDGVSPGQAFERVSRYVDGLKTAKQIDGSYYVDLTSFAHYTAGDMRRPLWLLWGAAFVVLLTGCANVAALLLSRVAGRRREMAIRISLGAGRGLILRQLMIESLMLGALGGAAGIGVAFAAVSVLGRAVLPAKELLDLVSIDGALLAYGLLLALMCGLVFGIAPAVQLIRDNQVKALARSRSRKLQGVFVSAEVAAALVLLIATGLLLRTLSSLGQIDPGFDPNHVSTAYLLKPKNDPGSSNGSNPGCALRLGSSRPRSRIRFRSAEVGSPADSRSKGGNGSPASLNGTARLTLFRPATSRR